MNRRVLIVIIIVLVMCICLVVAGTGGILLVRIVPSAPSWLAVSSTPTQPTVPPQSSTTADALRRTEIPPRDLNQIVPRLKKDLTLLTPVPVPTPPVRKVGDRDRFFVGEDMSSAEYRIANATLQVVTPRSLFWVEDGFKVDPAELVKSANLFDQSIIPTDVKYFGDIPPGPDGDTRINVFNGKLDAHVAGYYGSGDTHSSVLFPKSNQRNIIFMSLEASKPGTSEYHGVLAHELQHLIHHYQTRHDSGWINEGMSELAMKLNNLAPSDLTSFTRVPDTQLNTWSDDPNANGAHYAAAFLFFDYASQRFGPDFTRAVIRAPREGIEGVQTVLDQRANGMRFDDLFADWAVANILNDPAVERGRYAYANDSEFRIARTQVLNQYPVTRTLQMHEYAANYFTLQPVNGDVTIYFTGTTTAKLIAADAHNGKWSWYSNRADLANMTLTRLVDLTKVKKATLQFWTWFDIEKDYDYAYVEASTDGGKTWDTLPSKLTTKTNPGGVNYGNAYTGRSGVTDANSKSAARWMQDQIDLTPYAGKAILLRFEYITDDAVNLPGWAIDDITIPEINFSDGVETGENGWQVTGFIRSDNLLPQRFTVQVIKSGAQTQVVRIPLDASNRGMLTLNGFGKEVTKAILVVTPFAPTTTEPTEYQIGIAGR